MITFFLAVAVFGLMVGSFLNVCIGRLPAGESVVHPGSRCPSCKKPIAFYDNIPVLSYVLLRGRCRRCAAVISARYPLTELITAVAFVGQAICVGPDPLLLAQRLVLTAILIVLFGTDLETQRLPDLVTLPGIALGLVWSLWLPPGPPSALVGAACGAGVLWFVRWAWKRATGTDGMGLGDVKMMAMLGAFLGWQQVWLILFLASLTGAIVGVALAASKVRSLQSKLPFGTFLAAGAYIASLVGERLIGWYVSLY